MVSYFNQDIDFKFKDKRLTNRWLKMVAESEIKKLGDISIIFCSDNYILSVNMQYLQHDYFTDIITFDYVAGNLVSGDIMISTERVGENATKFGVPFEQELHRVIIHGVLHLLGQGDKTVEEASEMRHREEKALRLLETIK